MRKLLITLCLVMATSAWAADPAKTKKSVPKLESASALFVDAKTGEPIYAKDSHTVRSIASITKLMTALVVLDGKQPMNEALTISKEDIDLIKHTHSRLPIGTQLTRYEMLWLALMSSENYAASALARHYPGGKPAFIKAMQKKASGLGMANTRFVDSTGLDARNVSTAEDLVKMVKAASQQPLIRKLTTTAKHEIKLPQYRNPLIYKNTNALVRGGKWEIIVSKTGYTQEAGRTLVMNSKLGEREVFMVMLGAHGKLTPVGDATRFRKWLNSQGPAKLAEERPAKPTKLRKG
jgi:serine-type D-Ala-D-Ala endopeptidase (penicillin-binding protein 7)